VGVWRISFRMGAKGVDGKLNGKGYELLSDVGEQGRDIL
jgi:hypothetical protein